MSYVFNQVEDKRWGIYFEDRLLATVGNYELCKCINQSLNKQLSMEDSLKATMSYRSSIDRYLTVDSIKISEKLMT